ncbi:MAG: hypothetical protein JWM11_2697 [Planctomycetaceae bacterium]|nr:hypothetical protein [Planctomycetaceae bacterium]
MPQAARRQSWITNFGRNLKFRPRDVYTPRDEQELLAVLEQLRGRKIRVAGRLHSWSRVVATDDALIDLRHFNSVRIERRSEQDWALIGGGCQIKRALSELESQAGMTLPTIGLITEQSLAGSCSTGTHGSGKHSISHYIEEVRVANYDSTTGQPVIHTITNGPDLQAARCALGCLGIVVSVGLRCVPQYSIEESFRRYQTLDEILALEDEFPLQQFYWLPWLWEFFAQHRRVVTRQANLMSTLYGWYTFLVFDIGLHVAIWCLVKVIGRRFWIHTFLRWIAPVTVIQNWKVAGKSQALLVMEHELFRHIEIELFVSRQNLADAMDFVRATLEYLDGRANAINGLLRTKLEALDLWQMLDQKAGTYTHHYFICVRRVQPDETLISMSAGQTSDCYALSFISYAWPSRRQTFFDLAEFLTHSMAALFDARPHWGKVCPLTATEAERLYPRLEEFRRICVKYDPQGQFRNEWVSQVLFGENAPA